MSEAPKTPAQARALGLKWYLPDELCPKGHHAKRNVGNRECRSCVNAKRKANPEKQRAKDRRRNGTERRRHASRESYKRNAEKRRAADRERYAAEAEARKARALAWARANPAKRRVMTAQARRWIRQATPIWLSSEQRELIRAIYRDAATRPGKWEVDHIIPLRGKGVRGLHVPWNLRVITAKENRKKGNRYES